jgi:hypothetical protein
LDLLAPTAAGPNSRDRIYNLRRRTFFGFLYQVLKS